MLHARDVRRNAMLRAVQRTVEIGARFVALCRLGVVQCAASHTAPEARRNGCHLAAVSKISKNNASKVRCRPTTKLQLHLPSYDLHFSNKGGSCAFKALFSDITPGAPPPPPPCTAQFSLAPAPAPRLSVILFYFWSLGSGGQKVPLQRPATLHRQTGTRSRGWGGGGKKKSAVVGTCTCMAMENIPSRNCTCGQFAVMFVPS